MLTFTCAECLKETELVGRAPDGRLVCPVCLTRLCEEAAREAARVRFPIGPTEFKDEELDYDDFRGGRH
jgi:hypothetical protein